MTYRDTGADVESAHSLIESEFYDIEDSGSRLEFFRKAQLYQDFFNMTKLTSQKAQRPHGRSLAKTDPTLPLKLLFPVVDIDALFRFKFSMPSRGQFIPAFAAVSTHK